MVATTDVNRIPLVLLNDDDDDDDETAEPLLEAGDSCDIELLLVVTVLTADEV